jgi:hypothetical protein
MQKFNLDREFIHWFYDESYPLEGQTRCKVLINTLQSNPVGIDWLEYWLFKAFQQGAKTMFEEIDSTLLEFATHCEGLNPELLEPCEVFDRSRENLHSYVYKQLELF